MAGHLDLITKRIEESIELKSLLLKQNFLKKIEEISSILIFTIKNGGKIIFFGNGGSAADAQHLAAELLGKFKLEREPLPAVSLTTNTSLLTAISNDYSFDLVFSRQIKGIGNPKDLAFGISTSGNSKNVILGIEMAKKIGMKTVALLGKDGGEIKNIVDYSIIVPSFDTARIQEVHIMIGHILCEIVEKELSND